MAKHATDKDFISLSTTEVPYGNLQELYGQLLERYRKVVEEKDDMSHKSKSRLETHLQKELDFREKLGQLKGMISNSGSEDPKGDIQMSHIRGMHTEIIDTIGQIQGKTSKILQDQERDLIRAFRARLADVTDELERERKKNESGSVEWVQRCRKLTEELEWLRDLTEKLTSENKHYLQENRRFKRQLKTQEEDREFLIKQLVAVKKENARLRYSFEQAGAPRLHSSASQYERPSSASSRPRSAASASSTRSRPEGPPTPPAPFGSDQSVVHRLFPKKGAKGGGAPMTAQAEGRYHQVIAKLQKQIEAEQAKHHHVKQSRDHYTQGEAADGLQDLLVKCITDVKEDIAQRNAKRRSAVRRGKSVGRSGATGRFSTEPADIQLEEFSPSDRINVMEWLLSQDQIIYMLYDQMFPRM